MHPCTLISLLLVLCDMCCHSKFHAVLPQDLSLLISHQPHGSANKRRQQIRDIESVNDCVKRASSWAILRVWLGRESDEDQDCEQGHFACEDERGEPSVDVVVSHVLGGLQDVVAGKNGDDELHESDPGSFTHGGRLMLTVWRTFRPMIPLKANSLSRILCCCNFSLCVLWNLKHARMAIVGKMILRTVIQMWAK